MKSRRPWTWTAVNALGLGIGFVLYVAVGNAIRFGPAAAIDWPSDVPEPVVRAYLGILAGLLAEGAIFGGAQALALPARRLRRTWLGATVAGCGLTVAIVWPLMALGVFGGIPGPVEPVIVTVGAGTLAGFLQFLALRRHGVDAGRWLALWIVGLLASLVPAAALFMALEGLGVSVAWPMEVFLTGFLVAGVAAAISGRALFGALPRSPAGEGEGAPGSAGRG